jgi:hypothetical protein
MLKITGTLTGVCVLIRVCVYNFEVACTPIPIMAHVWYVLSCLQGRLAVNSYMCKAVQDHPPSCAANNLLRQACR